MCDKRDRPFAYVFCGNLHLSLCFLALYKKTFLKEGEVRGKVFQTELLSRLSHKDCRLLSSPVLLRKFTNKKPRELLTTILFNKTASLRLSEMRMLLV